MLVSLHPIFDSRSDKGAVSARFCSHLHVHVCRWHSLKKRALSVLQTNGRSRHRLVRQHSPHSLENLCRRWLNQVVCVSRKSCIFLRIYSIKENKSHLRFPRWILLCRFRPRAWKRPHWRWAASSNVCSPSNAAVARSRRLAMSRTRCPAGWFGRCTTPANTALNTKKSCLIESKQEN